MGNRLKTTRVNITLPTVLKEDLQERASLAGLSMSRYLSLLIKKKNKDVIIISDNFLYEIREIIESIRAFQMQGGFKTIELDAKLQQFIVIYTNILTTLRGI